MTSPVGNPHKDAFDPASYVRVTSSEAAAALAAMPEPAQEAVYTQAVDDGRSMEMMSIHQVAIDIVQNNMQTSAEAAFSGEKG